MEIKMLKDTKVDRESAVESICGKLLNLAVQAGASKEAATLRLSSPARNLKDVEGFVEWIIPNVSIQNKSLKGKEHELQMSQQELKRARVAQQKTEKVQARLLEKERTLEDKENVLRSRIDALEFQLEREKLENGRIGRELASKVQELSLNQATQDILNSSPSKNASTTFEEESNNQDFFYNTIGELQAQLATSNESLQTLEKETQHLRAAARISENEVNILKSYLEEKEATINKLKDTIGSIHQDIRDTEKATQKQRFAESSKQRDLEHVVEEKIKTVALLEDTIKALCTDVEGYLAALSGTGVGHWAAAAAQLTPLKLGRKLERQLSNNDISLDSSNYSHKSNQQDAYIEEQSRDLKTKIKSIKQRLAFST
mmetsp:Transcript_5276/g.7287  ORF Transcript_5276/g.7287 Transcript_5276/m.7287 type:complete len:373 (-) Transcript_5276:465-1583(-)